jgi:hypothetical protein
MPQLTDHIVFKDQKLADKFRNRQMPMADLYEAYFDGAIDIPGDIYAFLKDRQLLVKNTLTRRHLEWAVTHFIPEATNHTKSQDKRIVREHYDRGNDFFGWLLVLHVADIWEQRRTNGDAPLPIEKVLAAGQPLTV